MFCYQPAGGFLTEDILTSDTLRKNLHDIARMFCKVWLQGFCPK